MLYRARTFSRESAGLSPGIAADVVRIENDRLVEHWDVLQDEATKSRIEERPADVLGDRFGK